VRRTLSHFPGVVDAQVDLRKQQARLHVRPGFDQYRQLKQAVEAGGGEIQMFSASYVIPQPLYAALGVKDVAVEKMDRLRQRLQTVPGVRATIIDPNRWFTNENGLDVGGAAIFADPDPHVERDMTRAAEEVGFTLEPRMDGQRETQEREWSELNHRVAGLFLIFLAGLGLFQLGHPRPPRWIPSGTLVTWLGLFLFLLIRSDPEYWPIGKINWMEGFKDLESCQHRLGIGLLLPLMVGDFWRIRRGWKVNPALSRWGILAIAVIGGGMLFTHLHHTIDPAHTPMVRRMNLEHLGMATAVTLFGVSKFVWDTWKVPRGWGRSLWLIFLGILGLFLALYVE
jgi:putative copper resistance protein D